MLLIDTNGIIEAVRTGCWNAVTGQLQVETVEECRRESRAGNRNPGNITVSAQNLNRLNAVHDVSSDRQAAFELAYPDASGLDQGERDLLAHAFDLADDEVWRLCSPDKACVRAATEMGWADRLCSLERLADEVGERPQPPLFDHFSERWLSEWRTHFRMS